MDHKFQSWKGGAQDEYISRDICSLIYRVADGYAPLKQCLLKELTVGTCLTSDKKLMVMV